MERAWLSLVQSMFPLTPSDDEASFSAQGMDFLTHRFDAANLGSVSLMSAAGMGGQMKMTTLILNPFFVDAPLLSYDRIEAFGFDMLYLELFDTTLQHQFDVAPLDAVREEAKRFPDMDPGSHWYDSMRMGKPLIKKVPISESVKVTETAEKYIRTFLAACQNAPACDADAKRKAAAVYSEGLLTNGGPATDPVKAALGEEKTVAFFRNTLFGTNNA